MGNMFRGTGVALVTPFKEDKSVDYRALETLVDYQIENGTDYLVVLGTTGEYCTLTSDEKKKVIETVIKQNEKRVPVLVGLGGNNTFEVCEAVKAFNYDGVDAILSVVPFYNKPSQEGIYQHFMAIAEVCPVPIMLYNVPSRTGVSMTAETTIRLVENSDKFIAIKEASGDLNHCAKIIRDCPKEFAVISGDDGLIVPFISLGGQGVVSVSANPCPEMTSSITNAALSGDYSKAADLHMKMMDFIDLLFCEGSPAGAKAALAELGIMENELRLPLLPVSEEIEDRIIEAIQNNENSIV